MLMQIHTNQGLKSALEQLLANGRIRAIDLAFADFIYSEEQHLPQPIRDCICLLAAHLSAQAGAQHTCIELNTLGQPFLGVYVFPETSVLLGYLEQAHTIKNFDLDKDQAEKKVSKPIVIDNGQVYLQRYWQYEAQLAAIIRKKAAVTNNIDIPKAKTLLKRLFVTEPSQVSPIDNTVDWQKVAVCVAVSQSLSFITGGPGTGKTTTVTRLLALLQGLAATNSKRKGKPLNIQLVAPTGKAAARLTESISAAKLKLPADLQNDLPEKCQTIHRLLGAKPQSPYFKANASNPLHLDVLVLDEASMVDLPLMTKLFAALPTHAHVILLGDKDQLASVETGSVLSDICAACESPTESMESLNLYGAPLQQTLSELMDLANYTVAEPKSIKTSLIQNNLVTLLKSHRFKDDSGIGQLAKHINKGQGAKCVSLLSGTEFNDIDWYQPCQTNTQAVANEILNTLIVKLLPVYKAYLKALSQGDIHLGFKLLQTQQVLCAQKNGFWGVNQLNALIENELSKQGLIDTSKDFYIGRPVMLAKNDHQLKLFNGDIGLVMADPTNPSLTKVWFITPDGEIRGLLPSRLPSVETLYAMTIHKSQGSEFESVYLCLPPLTPNNQGRGLNRELIYTGLTRARKQFMLFAEQKALMLSLKQQCVRGSGLAVRLV
ncbi:exodeoxyribonuclease V subunit alpha [Paraglaciecola marina]|uniref:exodeoxyribonuclease V subunit alpha n=1 Tax=Paraglaciecola marina TaxID=2500157 RepID=UPI00105B2858|nr:exodeoxyribonuclease V subunit alpha [Paraglaciecola marina]